MWNEDENPIEEKMKTHQAGLSAEIKIVPIFIDFSVNR